MSFIPFKTNKIAFESQHIRTPRDNEYLIFSRVTRQLQHAASCVDRRVVIEAVNANNELWTTLLADLSEPGNGLPDPIKAGLLSLAIFSIRQGHRVLVESASTDVLIDINLRMMKGLRGEVQP